MAHYTQKIFRTTQNLYDLYQKGQRFVVFDVETLQGKGADNQHIVEIGAVEAGKNHAQRSKVFQRILKYDTDNWTQYFHSMRVHGIPQQIIQSGQDRLDVLEEFMDFIKDSVLITHSSVDVRAIKREIKRHEGKEEWLEDPIWGKYIDSLKVAREVLPDKSIKKGVSALAERFKIKHDSAHRALEDSITTKKVVRELIIKALDKGLVRKLSDYK